LRSKKAAAIVASVLGIVATAGAALAVNMSPATPSHRAEATPTAARYQNANDTPTTVTVPPPATTSPTPPTTVTGSITRKTAAATVTLVPPTSAPQVTAAAHTSTTTSRAPITSPPTSAWPPPPTTSTTQPLTFQTATYATAGGVVTVGCTSAFTIRLVSATPNDGYQAIVDSPGPQKVQVQLVASGKGLLVSAICLDGQPFRQGGGGE
jgi:hypothetical protein